MPESHWLAAQNTSYQTHRKAVLWHHKNINCQSNTIPSMMTAVVTAAHDSSADHNTGSEAKQAPICRCLLRPLSCSWFVEQQPTEFLKAHAG